MGRGSSKGGTNATKSNSSNLATSVIGAGGVKIDLSDNPLQYGDTQSMPEGVRKSIDEFEDKRRAAKIEFSRFVDADGNVIADNRGGKTSVSASYRTRMAAYAMSHNHPRANGSGELGGTFSAGDLRNFAYYNQQIYRATAAEGTYTIEKGQNFDSGFAGEYAKASKQFMAEHRAKKPEYFADYYEATKRYKSNGITWQEVTSIYNECRQKQTAGFNKFLVQCHNWLLENQKKYGYKYSLERSK